MNKGVDSQSVSLEQVGFGGEGADDRIDVAFRVVRME